MSLGWLPVLNHCVLLSSGVTFCAIFICIRLAPYCKLLDHPNSRKQHYAPTPVVGGIAVFMGLLTTIICMRHEFIKWQIFCGSAALLVIVGVLDDRHDLNAKTRLFCQLCVALLCVYAGNIELRYIGHLFFSSMTHAGPFSPVITILFLLTFINAMNMLDGLDGLAAGITLGQSLLLVGISISLGAHFTTIILESMIVMLIIFLAFNAPIPWRRHARIFLGDAGSTLLAFVIAWAAIDLSQHTMDDSITPITILWCVLLPFMDIVSVCYIRLKQGRSCMQAGHDHIHHLLMKLGMSRALSTYIVVLISFSYGLLGVYMANVAISESWQFLIVWVNLLMYVYITNKLFTSNMTMPIKIV